MKGVYKTLAVLVCWSIAAVAYASAVCTNGDIRLRGEERNATATSGWLEVCVGGSWTTVCNTGGWHSDSLNGISNNTRVACRQLGYSEEGATFTNSTQGIATTSQGLRQEMCSGSEQKLIDCPLRSGSERCGVGTNLTCAKCDTTIRLRGGRTATDGRVEVCRYGQWETVCDDSWDRNDASVACRQLGYTNFNAVAVPTAHFGAGSGDIYFSNLQCNGSEAALTDCTFDTEHQCSHNRDAGVICLPFNASIDIVHTDVPECANGTIRVVYDSEAKEVQLCSNQTWNMCGSICQNGVTQLGAYFCGSGEITHFLINGSQLYECPISGAGELFLICEPTTQTPATLANSCQQVLQDIELQATSSSITVTWGNGENFDNSSTFAVYEITCSLETSNLQASIILVEPTTSEVTMDNLPHSTTYECCVTLHIGRYSTRACNNTATLADETTAPDGASIALGVLVAVLVLLLVLATGAMLYLLIMRGKHKEGNASQSSTNRPQEYQLENPQYTTSPTLTPPSSTPHTLTTAAPPHTLTPPFPTEPHQYNNVVDTPMLDFTYDTVGEQPKRMNKTAAKLPTNGAPLPAREAGPEEGVQGSEYSALNRPEADLVYAVVDKKAKKKNRQAASTEAAYEVPQNNTSLQEEYSRLQHGKY